MDRNLGTRDKAIGALVGNLYAICARYFFMLATKYEQTLVSTPPLQSNSLWLVEEGAFGAASALVLPTANNFLDLDRDEVTLPKDPCT